MNQPTAHDNSTRGVWSMVVAVGVLALMDGCLKALSPHYPPLQIAALRGLSALPIALAWVVASGGLGRVLRVRFHLHVVRGVLGILMVSLFTYGIRRLPLANAYTIFFVAPLLITALAALLLREHVGAKRWVAICVGFAGVMIVLQPSGAGVLSAPGLAVLAAAVGYAISAITTRVLSRTDTTQSMILWLTTMISVGAGVAALPEWRPIQPPHWLFIAGIAVTGSLGQWAITEAFRHAEASLIAPLEYTALAWGAAMDWVFWHTAPSSRTLLGAAVIIASGVYVIRHETVHAEAEHP